MRNERGEACVELATQNNFTIGNTWFKVHRRRKWTWRSPGGNIKNQIDYFLIKSRFRNAIKSSKSYPGADCGSDHIPVVTELRISLRKLKKTKPKQKVDLEKLDGMNLMPSGQSCVQQI